MATRGRGKLQVQLACAQLHGKKDNTKQQQSKLVHEEEEQDQQPAVSKGKKVGSKQAEVRGEEI
jgi:hypothetical protein